MAEILAVTNKAWYRGSYLKDKSFCSLDIAIKHWRATQKISAQLVEKWQRYWQLKDVWGGGFQCISWSQPFKKAIQQNILMLC